MTPAIKIENLSKRYVINHEEKARYYSLRDAMTERAIRFGRAIRHPLGGRDGADASREIFAALDDISLEIQPGERLGIVGRNGAGKSTLLKVLSRITEPTTGSVTLRGRVASLLEVGTGFHPELTGRENIFLNGAILGMSRVEIARKFDAIVDFAEVERFLDTPVKRYSSGMYVRLAFSVAAHLESDILIVDEVLAVGDASFQKKCMGKMESVANEGRTILFVSHNMGAISELCTRAALLDRGRLVTFGAVADVISGYSSLTSSSKDAVLKFDRDDKSTAGYLSICLRNAASKSATAFDIAEAISVEVEYEVLEDTPGFQVTCMLSRNMIDILYSFDTDELDEIPLKKKGRYRATYSIPKMTLKAGTYTISTAMGTPDRLFGNVEHALRFTVEEWSLNTKDRSYRHDRPGNVIAPGSWTTVKLEEAQP
jgi:lipopolysaccharide transport system ATP-binding protein